MVLGRRESTLVLFGDLCSSSIRQITFYGINLNQSLVIEAVGLADSTEPWQYLFDLAKANVIIVAGESCFHVILYYID